jgi:hypothetical protein
MDCPCPILNAPLGNIINMLTGMLLSKLLGPRSKTAMHFVDEAWIAREKRAAEAGGVVKFVSTNDVVTSAFMRATRADMAMMVVNPQP